MKYFDANTWIVRWPFAFCDEHTPRTLERHLRAHGIRQALVSPLEAVFAPEPGPANRALLRATRGVAGLEPVPVINPALANWREALAAVAADPRVRAVRLLPNYHNYRLKIRAVDELVADLAERDLRLILQVRLIDHRHEYHAMKLKPVPVKELTALLTRHPRLAVLASGLLLPELMQLAPQFPHLLADLSFIEWHDTMEYVRQKVPAGQLAFASHTPLLITAAARAKLDTSTLPAADKQTVATGNLERWLG